MHQQWMRWQWRISFVPARAVAAKRGLDEWCALSVPIHTFARRPAAGDRRAWRLASGRVAPRLRLAGLQPAVRPTPKLPEPPAPPQKPLLVAQMNLDSAISNGWTGTHIAVTARTCLNKPSYALNV